MAFEVLQRLDAAVGQGVEAGALAAADRGGDHHRAQPGSQVVDRRGVAHGADVDLAGGESLVDGRAAHEVAELDFVGQLVELAGEGEQRPELVTLVGDLQDRARGDLARAARPGCLGRGRGPRLVALAAGGRCQQSEQAGERGQA